MHLVMKFSHLQIRRTEQTWARTFSETSSTNWIFLSILTLDHLQSTIDTSASLVEFIQHLCSLDSTSVSITSSHK